MDVLEKQLRSGSTLEKRCALWAIGNIAYSERGVEIVIARGLVKEISDLAGLCEHLSMRGVCLYILNMMGHTSRGREQLASLGW